MHGRSEAVRRVDVTGADVTRADLREADLTGAELTRADLGHWPGGLDAASMDGVRWAPTTVWPYRYREVIMQLSGVLDDGSYEIHETGVDSPIRVPAG